MSRKRSRARRCVVQALYQWQVGGTDPAEVDLAFLSEDPAGVDQAYFRELLAQIKAHADELDRLLAPLVDRPLPEVDPVERAVLWLGACELAYRMEIPFRVVINEGVELAKSFGAEQGHKFVNGILDRLAARLRPHEIEALRKT